MASRLWVVEKGLERGGGRVVLIKPIVLYCVNKKSSCTIFPVCCTSHVPFATIKAVEVSDMGDRLATIDMARKDRGWLLFPFRGELGPS